jgi:endo-1,4-beta-xylanase
MAGLSMGGMQTINIGLCECLDLFSAFGAFSAAPTSYPSAKIAQKLKAFPEDLAIRYFYNLCGTQDGIAYAAASAAAKTKPADSRLTEDNWCWQERPGEHNFKIWDLGLYNFLKLLGSLQE